MALSHSPVLDRFAILPALFDRSGALLRAAYRSGTIETYTKEMLSPMVTVTDRAVERALRELIATSFPHDAILGEEEALTSGSSAYQWVIDPIDGTSSLVRGLPLFGTLIGCIDHSTNEILFGGADQPILGERLTAVRGAPSRWNNEIITNPYREESSWSLADICLCATTPQMFTTPAERAVIEAVTKQCRRTAWGGDWYNFALMIGAKSAVPLAVVEAGLQFYDICALVPIIEEAGGVMTDWQGGAITPATTQVIAAPSRSLWSKLLGVVQGVA